MGLWVRTVKASVVFASIFPPSNSGEASCKNPKVGCKSEDAIYLSFKKCISKLRTLGFSGWSVFPTQLVCSSSCSAVGCKRVLPEISKSYGLENVTLTKLKWGKLWNGSPKSGVFRGPCDLLCVSLWAGPPIHRLAAKLDDLRASLSLTSSSTRCRSLEASDWDSSNKSPAGHREIISLSDTTAYIYI